MRANSYHQPTFECPSNNRETFNSEENSPLSIIDENTRSGDILLTQQPINVDVRGSQHDISEATVSKSYESWYCDKTNGSSYEKLINVNSTDDMLYSLNINDILVIENFNSPSTSDSSSSLSPNESLMSDSSDFSLKIKRSSSEICLPDLLPNKRHCPETHQNITFGDSNFSKQQKATDLANDDWHEQHILLDTSLHSFEDLYPDSNHFAPARLDYSVADESYGAGESSNLQALIEDVHKDLQFLNDAFHKNKSSYDFIV